MNGGENTHLGFPLARPLYTSDGELPQLVARVHRTALALFDQRDRGGNARAKFSGDDANKCAKYAQSVLLHI